MPLLPVDQTYRSPFCSAVSIPIFSSVPGLCVSPFCLNSTIFRPSAHRAGRSLRTVPK
jgi:hypothetical protein